MLIIANLVFILFYLQVEPVFLPACLNKAIQITSVSSISATNSIFHIISTIRANIELYQIIICCIYVVLHVTKT